MARISEAERQERIRKCVELLQQGLTQREIAERLKLSLPTVSNYIKVARKRGLLGEDEQGRKVREGFLRDFRALIENAAVIESLASRIDFNRSHKDVLKQVEEIKQLYRDELNALGYIALILDEEDPEKRDKALKDLEVDVNEIDQIKARFSNILRYVRILFVRDSIGVENEWRGIQTRNLYNFTRNEPLLEIEIHTDLETFKTRDRLDSLLRLIAGLLLRCTEAIHEISVNKLSVDPDHLRRCRERLRIIERVAEKAIEELRRRG